MTNTAYSEKVWLGMKIFCGETFFFFFGGEQNDDTVLWYEVVRYQ